MTSENFFLRPVTPEDWPVFYEQQLDPLATQMAAFPSREREAFMAHWAKISLNESGLLRAVIENEKLTGYLVSFIMEGHREVGYWFGREYWGHGLATRALAAFLQVETRRPLFGYVVKHNTGSRRVLEKCGFHFHEELENELGFMLRE